MSEYQYYEFVAVDAPLSAATMTWLRGLSTRAEITPTRFVNTYHWGNFKGDPVQMMVRGFDAHVYVSNFGYCRFMLSLPAVSIDKGRAEESCRGGDGGSGATLIRKGRCAILEFVWQCEDGGEWDAADDGSGWMGSLIPLREALLRDDWRSLYLAWLASVQSGTLDDTDLEPSVPPGLNERSGALEALARFLQVDPILVDVAAAKSPPLATTGATLAGLDAWVRALPVRHKDDALTRLLADESQAVRRAMLKRFRTERTAAADVPAADVPRRSVGELRSEWDRRVHAPRVSVPKQARLAPAPLSTSKRGSKGR